VALDPTDVRAFLNRPWGLLARETERHRAEMHRRDPEWTARTAAALRDEVSRANSDWPTSDDRAADLEHHLELRALFDRISHALRRRHRAR
jgi:hypothetical protein